MNLTQFFILLALIVFGIYASDKWVNKLPNRSSITTSCSYDSQDIDIPKYSSSSDVIFIGEAILVKDYSQMNRWGRSSLYPTKVNPNDFLYSQAQIYVTDVYKGSVPGNVSIESKELIFPYNFKKGSKYLIFANNISSPLKRMFGVNLRAIPCGILELSGFGELFARKLGKSYKPSSNSKRISPSIIEKMKVLFYDKIKSEFVDTDSRRNLLANIGAPVNLPNNTVVLCSSDSCPASVDLEKKLKDEGIPYYRLNVETSESARLTCDFYLDKNIDFCGGPNTKLRAPFALVGHDAVTVTDPDFFISFYKNKFKL